MERTFVMVKPDGVRRGLVGEIIRRFEAKGLRIAGLKRIVPTRDLTEAHYAVHRGKPFYEGVVEYVSSGPVVVMVLEGEDGAIEMVRMLMGKTSPLEAAPGTIRGDFAHSTRFNLVHGSDSAESAASEIALWFRPDEMLG